jgi:hypothetical protein
MKKQRDLAELVYWDATARRMKYSYVRREKPILIFGDEGGIIEAIFPQVMEIGKVYNMKQDVWHTAILSWDASILIVENQDTEFNNSNDVICLRNRR